MIVTVRYIIELDNYLLAPGIPEDDIDAVEFRNENEEKEERFKTNSSNLLKQQKGDRLISLGRKIDPFIYVHLCPIRIANTSQLH